MGCYVSVFLCASPPPFPPPSCLACLPLLLVSLLLLLLQLSSVVSCVTYSFPATLLLEKAMHLAKMHFDLKSTIITGIPMKVRDVILPIFVCF